jgi:hypothetical protein
MQEQVVARGTGIKAIVKDQFLRIWIDGCGIVAVESINPLVGVWKVLAYIAAWIVSLG